MSESCAQFLENFVAPFVGGKEAKVGAPIDAPTMEEFARQLPEASVGVVAVDDFRDRILRDIVVRPPTLLFDEDDLHLAGAVYNLLFLAHPEMDGGSSRVRAKIVAAAKHFASREPAKNRKQIMARYALLANLHRVTRVDTEVKWWTGKASFQGMEVPRRLTRWRSVRRVEETETRVGHAELYAGPECASIIASLARRSPLTQLLAPAEVRLHIHWESVVLLLQDAELCRSVAYSTIAPLEETRNPLDQICRFASEFEQMLERRPSNSDVRVVTAFLIHLSCLMATGKDGPRNTQRMIAALASTRRPRGLATFMCLPIAVTRLNENFIPEEVYDDPDRHSRMTEWQELALESIGEPFVEGLVGRLQRHFTSVIVSAETENHGSAATQ